VTDSVSTTATKSLSITINGVITTTTTSTTQPPLGGGGGSNAGGPSAPTSIAGVTDVSNVINAKGVLSLAVNPWSDDKKAVLVISGGTTVLDPTGAPITQISILHMATPPAFPSGTGIVALAYDFQPSGVTFSLQPVIRFQYDPRAIPDGVAETSLQIAFYDATAGKWVALVSDVDVGNHFITAQIAHFTSYAVTFGLQSALPALIITTTMATTTTTTPPQTSTSTQVTTSTAATTKTTAATLPATTDTTNRVEFAPISSSTTTPSITTTEKVAQVRLFILTVAVAIAMFLIALTVTIIILRRSYLMGKTNNPD